MQHLGQRSDNQWQVLGWGMCKHFARCCVICVAWPMAMAPGKAYHMSILLAMGLATQITSLFSLSTMCGAIRVMPPVPIQHV